MKRPAYTRLFLACLSVAGSSIAHAGEGDMFTPYVGYGYSSDNNLLRAPEGQNTVSDTWETRTFGLRFDKTISRQHLTADLSINDSKYDRLTEFNNDGKNGQANWGWQLGNHLSGDIGASYNRSLTPFLDQSNTGGVLPSSIQTQQRKYINGAWQFHPSWQVTAAYSRYDLNYESAAASGSDLQLNTTELAIDDYPARAAATFGLLLRHSAGKFPNQVGGDYTEDEVKGNLRWTVSGRTNLQFLGGWARRNFDDSEKNFTGPDARLTANWNVTGKTTLTAAVWRELGSADLLSGDPRSGTTGSVASIPNSLPNTLLQQDISANYSRNTGASLSANWQATAKTSFDAAISSESRDYHGIGNTPSDRSDRYRRNTIGITFLPFRQLNIRASVYQQQLDSNVDQATFRDKGFQISTRYEF